MNFIKTFLAGLLAFFVGMCLVVVFWIAVIAGLMGSMEKSVSVPAKAILKIDLAEGISDAPVSDPMAGFDPATLRFSHSLSLMEALRALEAAADDERIQGIYLRLNGGGGVGGAAVMEELREAIAAFRESGKFVVSYNETYSQGAYYLASAADKIYMQPEGGMDWVGMSSQLMFYKGLLDKLDLKVEVFRPTVCRYKSAVEPYILTRMSDENRRQMQELVDSMWATLSGDVCEARGIDPAEMKRLTDNLQVVLPEDALAHGFVDGLVYEDQMDDIFAELGAEKEGDDYAFVTLGDYASQVTVPLRGIDAGSVAVVYADGEIVDGEGSGKIYGNTLARTLREQREDDKVKAVVVRVNSPGGSALASDIIWREMELLRAEKPVVVSMGSYAASGGYYISCPADVVLADRLTLTGSIGVFGMYLYTPDALKNKLGITLDGVKSNASADMGTMAPLTPAQRASIMRGVDKVYETFTGKVAAGRNLPVERVLEIAGGRVWSGTEAKRIGLIDDFGGLKAAVAVAADKAGLGDDYRVVEAVDEPSGMAAFFASLDARVRAAFARPELDGVMEEYAAVKEALSQRGVVMYCPYKVGLE